MQVHASIIHSTILLTVAVLLIPLLISLMYTGQVKKQFLMLSNYIKVLKKYFSKEHTVYTE